MSRRTLTSIAASTAVLVVPASAVAAPSISVDKRCYQVNPSASAKPFDTVTVTGTGFTPNAALTIRYDDLTAAEGKADFKGQFVAKVDPPSYDDEPTTTRTVEMSVSEDGNASNTVTKGIRTSIPGYQVDPPEAGVKKKVSWRIMGFPAGKVVYGHFYSTKAKKQELGRVTFGKPRGACGLVDVRAVIAPVKPKSAGRYVLQIDQRKQFKYHFKGGTGYVDYPVKISF